MLFFYYMNLSTHTLSIIYSSFINVQHFVVVVVDYFKLRFLLSIHRIFEWWWWWLIYSFISLLSLCSSWNVSTSRKFVMIHGKISQWAVARRRTSSAHTHTLSYSFWIKKCKNILNSILQPKWKIAQKTWTNNDENIQASV